VAGCWSNTLWKQLCDAIGAGNGAAYIAGRVPQPLDDIYQLVTIKNACFYLCFIHVLLSGYVVGMAEMAETGFAGGICDNTIFNTNGKAPLVFVFQ